MWGEGGGICPPSVISVLEARNVFGSPFTATKICVTEIYFRLKNHGLVCKLETVNTMHSAVDIDLIS